MSLLIAGCRNRFSPHRVSANTQHKRLQLIGSRLQHLHLPGLSIGVNLLEAVGQKTCIHQHGHSNA